MAGVSSVTPLPPILVSSSFAGERRRHDEETIFEKEDDHQIFDRHQKAIVLFYKLCVIANA